ncbi:hypothetical protein [Deinococcus ruber]|uniref:hypothetical protein n=1 Tax=Deinococcus ruber TaxID=1848197 RepID=UPI00166A75F5|nr:hypothetical protein [Deinococcus ruber]
MTTFEQGIQDDVRLALRLKGYIPARMGDASLLSQHGSPDKLVRVGQEPAPVAVQLIRDAPRLAEITCDRRSSRSHALPRYNRNWNWIA